MQWLDRQGFSLLLYGFGSKRDLLDSFAAEYMVDGGVLSVNGMSSALTVKKMLVEALCMLQRGSAANYRLIFAFLINPCIQPHWCCGCFLWAVNPHTPVTNYLVKDRCFCVVQHNFPPKLSTSAQKVDCSFLWASWSCVACIIHTRKCSKVDVPIFALLQLPHRF